MSEHPNYIRITIEHVHNDTRTVLGRAYVTETGGDKHNADFLIKIMKAGFARRLTWKTGAILDVPRSRTGPWDVLFRLLHATVGVRNAGACDPQRARKHARHNAKRKETDGQHLEGARGASGE